MNLNTEKVTVCWELLSSGSKLSHPANIMAANNLLALKHC